MLRKINYIKKKRTCFYITLVLAILVFSGSSFASVIEEKTLSGSPDQGLVLRGGAIQVVNGKSGWLIMNPSPTTSESIVLKIDPEQPLFMGSGSLEFDIRRLPRIREGYKTTSAYNTILDVLDNEGNSLLTLYVIWEFGTNKGARTAIEVTAEKSPINIWGDRGFLSKVIPPGGDAHVVLTWGETPEDCRLYLNGEDLTPPPVGAGKRGWKTRQEVEKRIPLFREALKSASELVFGVDIVKGRGPIEPATEVFFERLVFHDVPLRIEYDVIRSLTNDAFKAAGYSGKLVEGNKYTVTMVAEPGGSGTFDLGPVKSHAMTESADKPGTYKGVHIVKYGEDVEDGEVIGHFSNSSGLEAVAFTSPRPVTVDTKVYMDVKSSSELLPADENSRAGITVAAVDANGNAVRKHPLKLTMSTTDEYTGIVGGGTFEKMVGGEIDVDWGGVTDSFGEVTAQYLSGFAAKTILVSAKDMVSGDVGVGYVRAYIDGTVDVLVKRPAAVALGLAGSMEVSASRDWLTADGSSRSRITSVVKDRDGSPVEGDQIKFTLLGSNGSVKAIKSRTDSRGRAFADYIAGTVIGQVQIEVRDMTAGHSAVISIELRSDAPAEVALSAEPGEVFTDDKTGSVIAAKVTDANGNPNFNTDVLFEVASGGGRMSAPKAVTDEKDGVAQVTFLPGSEVGLSTIKATVISRIPTAEEISAAEGAVFLYGLADDPGRLEVVEWYAEPGDGVSEGQDLVKLEDRHGTFYTVKSPREGTLATFVTEERDRVIYGQTLGYVLPLAE